MRSSWLFTRDFWHLPFCALTCPDSARKQSVYVGRQGLRKVRLLPYADHLKSSTYLLSSCIYNLQLLFFSCYGERYIFQHTLERKSSRLVNTDTHSFDIVNWIKWSLITKPLRALHIKMWNAASKFCGSKSIREFNKWLHWFKVSNGRKAFQGLLKAKMRLQPTA